MSGGKRHDVVVMDAIAADFTGSALLRFVPGGE
jgi:hypothetical protein